MRHVRLGRTGLWVSRLCLGTMTFGVQVLPAVETALGADLEARLDALTREYRRGDDPR